MSDLVPGSLGATDDTRDGLSEGAVRVDARGGGDEGRGEGLGDLSSVKEHLVLGPDEVDVRLNEIGRASCRERVS